MNVAIEHILKIHDDLYYVIGYDLATFEKMAVRGTAAESLDIRTRFNTEGVCVLELPSK